MISYFTIMEDDGLDISQLKAIALGLAPPVRSYPRLQTWSLYLKSKKQFTDAIILVDFRERVDHAYNSSCIRFPRTQGINKRATHFFTQR